MRAPIGRITFEPGALVVDNFAGGGGASTGIEQAIGRPVDIAINHDAAAIAMHERNHPETRHYQEDIWEVDPKEACGSRPVALAWFSPDCTHFSRAKGDKPREKKIRALAWVVVRWAQAVRPATIMLENVEEFTTWGPLRDDGRPDPGHAGETFRAWLAKLVDLGYEVEFRSLVAADYGAPTSRKRFFLIARRRDAYAPIVWPEPTHGRGRSQAWRPASEVIDWSLPCPSIFERARPLADATLRRIALGVRRYVLETASPFLVPLTHARRGDGSEDNRVHGVGEPVRTITGAHRGELALVSPYMVRTAHGDVDRNGKRRGRGTHELAEPLPTVCASGGDFALAVPTLIQTSYGERPGQAPLGTVVAGGQKHALVAAFLAKHFGGVVGHGVQIPLGTVTSKDHHSLVVSHLTKFYGTCIGADVREPAPTITANDRGGGHIAEVQAFLVKYYSGGGRSEGQGQSLFEPMHTVTTKDRFGLVTIAGVDYAIADIGMRMLQPHELFAAQAFPDDYDIAPQVRGKPITKTDQIRLCGNAVNPTTAEALVSAQVAA